MKIQDDVKNYFIKLLFNPSFAFLILAFFIQGCANSENGINSKVFSIDGLLLEVESQSLLQATSVILVDSSGEEHKLFLGGTYGEFTPSHLREHMITAMPISVEYLVKDEKWNVIAISDDSDSNQHE